MENKFKVGDRVLDLFNNKGLGTIKSIHSSDYSVVFDSNPFGQYTRYNGDIELANDASNKKYNDALKNMQELYESAVKNNCASNVLTYGVLLQNVFNVVPSFKAKMEFEFTYTEKSNG